MAATTLARLGILHFLFFLAFMAECAGVLERNELIERYFRTELGYNEILIVLGLLLGITLSIRQLKRILRPRGLGRRTLIGAIHDRLVGLLNKSYVAAAVPSYTGR